MRLSKIALTVESMKYHTTDEGWQIFSGLHHNGYKLCGYNLPIGITDINKILLLTKPDILVIQDPREWDILPHTKDFREPRARFINIHSLKKHRCYKVSILKDAHQKPYYHREMSEEMGIHNHIIYYDEKIVRNHAKWLGPTIRTWHTIDSNMVPPCTDRRGVAILSGAISAAYPLRKRLTQDIRLFPKGSTLLTHPGYHRRECCTPKYLHILSQYRVAICTCSIYQYALRKLIEATACGCRVITNLSQERLPPGIEDNFTIVKDDISTKEVVSIVEDLYSSYDKFKQYQLANIAKHRYDYRTVTRQLAYNIEVAYMDMLDVP